MKKILDNNPIINYNEIIHALCNQATKQTYNKLLNHIYDPILGQVYFQLRSKIADEVYMDLMW